MPQLPLPDLEHILKHIATLWEDMRGQRIFLTGGTGFVGTWLLESLLFANDRLNLGVTIAMLTRDGDRYRARSPHLAGHTAVCVLEGDITDFDFPDGTFPLVIHAATASAFVPDKVRPLGAFDTDVNGTRRVLEFARTHGAQRLLFTSSGAVYGEQPAHVPRIAEEYTGGPATTDPRSCYGQAKRVSEYMCSMYGRVYGFDAAIARLFAFVGPLLPLDGTYAAGNFIRDALSERPVRISGDGTPYRSYLYAADLAIWLWTILLRGRNAYPYNVGSQNALTIADLARTVAVAIAPSVRIVVAGTPVPGVPALRYVPDVRRAEEELGLRSVIPLDEGVRRTAAWYARGGGR